MLKKSDSIIEHQFLTTELTVLSIHLVCTLGLQFNDPTMFQFFEVVL